MSKKFLFILIYFSIIVNCETQWVQVRPGTETIYSFILSGSNIFAGESSGITFSSNNGNSWQTSFNQFTYRLANNSQNIFAGTFSGLFYTTNNGLNWIINPLSSLYQGFVRSVAANGPNIFVGTDVGSTNGVYRSTNGGLNWSVSLVVSFTGVFGLIANDSMVLASTKFGLLYRSTNNGQNWTLISTIPTYAAISFLFTDQNIFAAGSAPSGPPSGVFVSTNTGLNWTMTSLNINCYSLEMSGTNIFAGTDTGVYVSTNNGASWIQKNEGMGNLIVASVFAANGYLFAGTGEHSIWRRPLSELIGIN